MLLDPLAPLILPAERSPDFSDQDWANEIEQHWERQLLTDKLLSGEIPADILLDCLRDQGISPDWYCDYATAQIERAIKADIRSQMDPNEVICYAR